MLENCERDGSSDVSINNPIANDFSSFFIQYPNIKYIYFNGKKAEMLYQKLVEKDTRNRDIYSIALSSSSPANAIKFELKQEEWRKIILTLKA